MVLSGLETTLKCLNLPFYFCEVLPGTIGTSILSISYSIGILIGLVFILESVFILFLNLLCILIDDFYRFYVTIAFLNRIDFHTQKDIMIKPMKIATP